MQLLYFKDPSGNFGDDLNGWLWERLKPGIWRNSDRRLFAGIGTILGDNLPNDRPITVFSSGAGYLPPPHDFGSPRWNIVALRGPLSCEVLNQPPQKAVADGALLIATLPEFKPLSADQRSGVIFIPHHKSVTQPGWAEACAAANIALVDPRDSSIGVVHAIRTSKLVIAESMHAAIIADVLRVPWIPVVFSPAINSFKWLDWSLSLGVPYEPEIGPPPSSAARRAARRARLYGEVHALTHPTASRAVKHYRAAIARRRSSLQTTLRRKAGRAGELGLKLFEPTALHANAREAERANIAETAEFLSSQAARAGYLSDLGKTTSLIERLSHELNVACSV